jgi:DNA-3-methyladenine glycosylase II
MGKATDLFEERAAMSAASRRGQAVDPNVSAGPSPLTFTVRLDGPLDVPASLEVFRRSGDDLLDRWDGINLIRTAALGGQRAAFHCTSVGTLAKPVLHVSVAKPAHRTIVEPLVRAMTLTAPPDFDRLLKIDPVLARLNALHPGFRQVRQFDLLTALVRCISAQQVNLRWAATTRRRLAEAFGKKHRVGGHFVYSLSAKRLAGVTVAQMRALQFTTRKAEYLIGAAAAVASGHLDASQLATLPDEEVIAGLTALRGIGVWTAEWILARTLGRPRVVAGDLGVRKAVGLAYLNAPLPPEDDVRRATAHWGPSAGVAQALLLHALSQGTLAK